MVILFENDFDFWCFFVDDCEIINVKGNIIFGIMILNVWIILSY